MVWRREEPLASAGNRIPLNDFTSTEIRDSLISGFIPLCLLTALFQPTNQLYEKLQNVGQLR
jgi:hypothetical protein